MRNAGNIEREAEARVFSSYLYGLGIENEVERRNDGTWAVWIVRDEQLAAAEQELEAFLANPADEKYKAGALEGEARFSRDRAEESRSRARRIDVRHRWFMPGSPAVIPLTFALMATAISVTVLQWVLGRGVVESVLSMSSYAYTPRGVAWAPGLQEIRAGEVWRLITPIFMHASITQQFGFMHILFNMMWLQQLGGSIERTQGTRLLAVQVLVMAVASNLAQYYFSGPFFYGFSGVNYGLFGYVWIHGYYHPAPGYTLDRQSVILMIVWFVLCFTGAVGPIANAAHAAGFAVGILWATIKIRRIPFTQIRF
ncbi:MAG: rhomboid family intramembrane serine protease [Candidatus Sumerlaeaceae bacterium]|nr:rhomboid family intramembrane serine protease [Candidatus Sumerlaeaceae bacterium]